MKALLCHKHGPPEDLRLEEAASPSPGPGEVLVEVRACGVNFPDTLIIQGKYQFQPEMPFAPGGEIAGIVTALGDGVGDVSVGDRVIAFTGWGGFAEQVAVSAGRVIPMPEGMDFVTAASFVMAYGTSHHALSDRAELREGETLLVLGAAGGVGLAAVQIGKTIGARVIAAASTDEKLEICRRFGADETINYATQDLRERLREITGKSGVDVVYDPVGGDLAEPALRSLGWEGRYLVVGFAAGDIPRIPLNLPLLKGCSVVGVFWGEFARREPRRNAQNLRELMEWLSAGRLQPHVSAVYPLERGGEALRALMDREVTGKVVLTTTAA
jgi:NADPH:quinone reductase